MPAEEFVRRIGLAAEQNDTHFVFWIGAGCSISSGIPGAATLTADRWLPKLYGIRGSDTQTIEEWAKSALPDYDPDNPAAGYGAVMEDLFMHPEARQREVEALCEGRYPGFGYAVLAALMARDDGLFSVALTTNFDDLIADAMYLFTDARPLVIPDEALAGYIRPNRMRPLVVKVHGDHRLSPQNTQTETGSLKEGISEGIHNLLHDRGVVFIGYGGNDTGIAEVLRSLPKQALPLGVWWVNREWPDGILASWLEEREAVWVQSRDFDELMLLFRDQFNLDPPSPDKFDRVFKKYLETYRELSERVERIPDSDADASSLKGATQRAEQADLAAPTWSSLLLRMGRLTEVDPQEAERVYRQGIEQFPGAPLVALDFAHFLLRQSRPEDALKVLDEALESVPRDFYLLINRGHALDQLGRKEEAISTMESALEVNPNDVRAKALFGIVLARAGDAAAASAQLEECLEMHRSGADELGQIAVLQDQLGRYEDARVLHARAVEEEPEDGNFHANFARNLIALGERGAAVDQIEQALSCLSPHQYSTFLEVFFYRFVISPDEGDEALSRIKNIILEGGRSFAWTLAPVVEYGRTVEHPDAAWLSPLAEVIEGRAAPSALDEWDRWTKA